MKVEPGFVNVFSTGGFDFLIAEYEIARAEKIAIMQQVWLLDSLKKITQIFYTTCTRRI